MNEVRKALEPQTIHLLTMSSRMTLTSMLGELPSNTL